MLAFVLVRRLEGRGFLPVEAFACELLFGRPKLVPIGIGTGLMVYFGSCSWLWDLPVGMYVSFRTCLAFWRGRVLGLCVVKIRLVGGDGGGGGQECGLVEKKKKAAGGNE